MGNVVLGACVFSKARNVVEVPHTIGETENVNLVLRRKIRISLNVAICRRDPAETARAGRQKRSAFEFRRVSGRWLEVVKCFGAR